MAFDIRQIPLADANAFVIAHHRHHGPLRFHLFSLGAYQGEKLCGVSIVFRPVSRYLDDGRTAEVLRKAQRNQRVDMPWLSWLKQEAENG